MMAKSAGLLRIVAGIAAAAVALSRESSRNKLKASIINIKKIQKAINKMRKG